MQLYTSNGSGLQVIDLWFVHVDPESSEAVGGAKEEEEEAEPKEKEKKMSRKELKKLKKQVCKKKTQQFSDPMFRENTKPCVINLTEMLFNCHSNVPVGGVSSTSRAGGSGVPILRVPERDKATRGPSGGHHGH